MLYYPEILDGYAEEYRGLKGIAGFLAIEPLFPRRPGFAINSICSHPSNGP